MTSRLSDAEFIEHLRAYEREVSGSEIVPIFYAESGKVNREKTLALVVFDGMTEQKKAELL